MPMINVETLKNTMTRGSQFLIIFICALGTRSISAQEKLFQLIPGSESGVTFQNTVVDKKDHSILQYSNYYGGAGVAIGDLNNDGLQDLYFAANLDNDKLYKNLGGLKFEDVSQNAGLVENGEWASAVILGDVNNDGWLDIYVTCELYDESPSRRKNKLYINQGDFTFKESAKEYGVADTERTRGATFLDYNKDGWLDLFLLNQPPNPGNYSIYFGQNLMREEWSPRLYKNNGNGSFSDVSKEAGINIPCYPNSVVAADVDNDGWQDLYVSNDYDSPDFLYKNNGDGTFSNTLKDEMRHISYYSMGVDIADINNDNLLDIMTLDMVAEDNFRQKANMGGMYPEAFWKLVKKGGHYQYMYNALQLNQGNNTFSDIAQLSRMSNTDWSWSNVIADFDNDGWKDVYVTNGLLRDIRNSDAAKKFPEYVRRVANEFIENNPNAGDVDIMDIIDLDYGLSLHPSVPISNYAYKNQGNLQFEKVTSDWGLEIPSFSNGCAYGDLDNDGDLDIVVNNINREAFLFENKANSFTSNNYLRVSLTDTKNERSLMGARIKITTLEGNQLYEVGNARGMYSYSESTAHFGLGKAEVADVKIIWPNGSAYQSNGITANQHIKIDISQFSQKAELDYSSTSMLTEITSNELNIDFQHVEDDFDDFEKQVLLPHEMSHHGPALAVADVNGDGLEDMYLGGAAGQPSALYIQESNGTFSNYNWMNDDHSSYEDVDATFFDIDNDGDKDLYVVSGGNHKAPRNINYLDRLYVNDGKGNFSYANKQIPRILESGSVVRALDYDNDGDIDLFIGGRHQPWDYPSPTISRLLINEGGELKDRTKKLAKELINIGMVTDARWTDYNADGQTDLIIVGEWMPITFLKNNEGKLKVDKEVSIRHNGADHKTSGWWNSLLITDINGDGKEDILAGNLGLNYKYKSSQQEPFSVHYDDFDESGQKDIVLSYYNFGERFPLRGRSCSSQQIPDIKKDFPSYDIFASSNLVEVYGEDNLSSALQYDAHEFGHVTLLKESPGKYELQLLDPYTQLSSINTIFEKDIDGDGINEFILAGNMYQAEVETPRNDGGIGSILTTTNKQLTHIPAKNSGLYLPYDVRKIESITIKGVEHLVIANNDDTIKLYKINTTTQMN